MSIFSDILSTVAPWLSAGLNGGPVGLAALAADKVITAIAGEKTKNVDTIVATAKNLLSTVSNFSPEQKAALTVAENEFKLSMMKAGYANTEALQKMDLDQLAVVNSTMVEELKNSAVESWYQKAWRPTCGFAVAVGSFVAIVFCAASVYRDPEAIRNIPALADSIALILAVPGAAVGITAWHRGMMQREAATASK